MALATDFFFLRAFLRGGVAPAIEHKSVLQRLPFDFVVDVGANRGQFSLICRWLRPAAVIVTAFEPLAEPAEFTAWSSPAMRWCNCMPVRWGRGGARSR